MITAEAMMSADLITIRPDDTIEKAIEMILAEQISGLPVIDDRGHLVGVITEFALLAIVYDHQVKNQTVSEHMTRDVITIDGNETIGRAADLCIVHRVRRLPVLKNGRLVGLIARRDVLRALHGSQAPLCMT